jgi:hypothetical protein
LGLTLLLNVNDRRFRPRFGSDAASVTIKPTFNKISGHGRVCSGHSSSTPSTTRPGTTVTIFARFQGVAIDPGSAVGASNFEPFILAPHLGEPVPAQGLYPGQV